jgi:hypothetical protein
LNVCMNAIKSDHRCTSFKYWHTQSSYKQMFLALQSVSGRIYTSELKHLLECNDKIPNGWNNFVLFTPSAKKTNEFFKKIKSKKIKFETEN